MLSNIIEIIQEFFLKIFVDPRIVTVFIAILPIVEARLAIPFALAYDLSPFESWFYSFVGSSLIVPLLLLVLIPFIKWLAKTRLFRKVGTYLYEKFEQKSKGIKTDETTAATEAVETSATDETAPETKKEKTGIIEWFRKDFKKMLGVFVFVAIPVPLTGVWTGSAVASIIGLPYPKAVISVILGNLTASSIIIVLSIFFSAYIDYIIAALFIIAALVIVVLIIKIIISKPKTAEQKSGEGESDTKE